MNGGLYIIIILSSVSCTRHGEFNWYLNPNRNRILIFEASESESESQRAAFRNFNPNLNRIPQPEFVSVLIFWLHDSNFTKWGGNFKK